MREGDLTHMILEELFSGLSHQSSYRPPVKVSYFRGQEHGGQIWTSRRLQELLEASTKAIGVADLDPFVKHLVLRVQPSDSRSHGAEVSERGTKDQQHGAARVVGQRQAEGGEALGLGMGIEAFDRVKLSYSVTWPVSLVITEKSLSIYEQIFSFFVRVKRVQWDLRQLWNLFMQRERARATIARRDLTDLRITLKNTNIKGLSQVEPRFQGMKSTATPSLSVVEKQTNVLVRARKEMAQLMDALQGYLMTQVLEQSYKELNRVDRVRTIVDLVHLHETYVQACTHSCFLDEATAPVMSIFTPIFKCILQFKALVHNNEALKTTYSRPLGAPPAGSTIPVSSHPPAIDAESFAAMRAVIAEFRQLQKFLLDVVKKLADRGHDTMQDLAIRMDFNNFYQSE